MVEQPDAAARAHTGQPEARGLFRQGVVQCQPVAVAEGVESPFLGRALPKPVEDRWTAQLDRAKKGVVADLLGLEVAADRVQPAAAELLIVDQRPVGDLALHLAENLEAGGKVMGVRK